MDLQDQLLFPLPVFLVLFFLWGEKEESHKKVWLKGDTCRQDDILI